MTTILSTKTNEYRADRAEQVLGFYTKFINNQPSDEIDESDITDLIADLLHLCDRLEFDIEAILRMSQMHHEAEANGEDDYLTTSGD